MWFWNVLLFLGLCGAVYCLPQGRVVNGSSTTVSNYPFMISLRSSTGSHMCGGTIIAPRWIMTAAHCVVRRTADKVNIQFASTVIEAKSPNVMNVSRILIHEGYNAAKSHANDIALLELASPVVYNYRTIAPIALPETYFEVPQTLQGTRGTLIGWGINATGGSAQRTLQAVELKIYSDAECNQRHFGVTSLDHICGGEDAGGKGQCYGDSGGPLIYEGSIQLGIVSWSIKPCASGPYPGVYTKVSHYIDWIYRHIDAIF